MICRGCGQDARHVVTTFTSGGHPVEPYDTCELCNGTPFGRVGVPSDKKMYPDWEANPTQYRKRGDTYVATDEWQADMNEFLDHPPVAETEERDRLEKKRAFARVRNRHPMSQMEIKRQEEILNAEVREQEKEDAQKAGALAAGLVLPG